jgi:ABC-2 type transport system ATP-binding protein
MTRVSEAVSGASIEVTNLTQRFADVDAIDDLSLRIEPGRIVGLLGRNGSGKTTLMSLLAAFRKPTSGSVLVDGVDPFENPQVCNRIALVRESGDVIDSSRVSDMLGLARRLRSTWDQELADRLVDRFRLPLDKRVQALSRGQRSVLGIVLGLAARAPLTMLDESYLGMDAPSRQVFYDELLADYMEHPRTIILSTHLIDEVAPLFEDVVIIDRGRLVLHDSADDLRARGADIIGPTDVVESFTAGMNRIATKRLGGTTSIVVYGELSGAERAEARALGLELGPVGVQDLFVHLTAEEVVGA